MGETSPPWTSARPPVGQEGDQGLYFYFDKDKDKVLDKDKDKDKVLDKDKDKDNVLDKDKDEDCWSRRGLRFILSISTLELGSNLSLASDIASLIVDIFVARCWFSLPTDVPTP